MLSSLGQELHMFRISSTLSLALFSFAALAHSTAPVASADQAGPSLQIAQVVQEEAIVEEQAGEEAQPAAAPGAPAGGVSSGQVDRPLVIVGEIGRASCRARVWIWAGVGSLRRDGRARIPAR